MPVVPPQILHVIEKLDGGDASQQLALLQRRAADLPQTICSLAPLGKGASMTDSLDAAVVTCNKRFSYDVLSVAALARIIRTQRPAVVHTWDETSARQVSLVRAFSPKFAWVVGGVSLDWIGAPPPPAPTRTLVATREATRQRHAVGPRSAGGWRVVLPGVETPAVAPARRAELLSRWQLTGDEQLIGVVGPLVVEHQVESLIWAFDMLRIMRPQLRLVVVGDGPLHAHLHRYADRASTLQHVVFGGAAFDTAEIMPLLDMLWSDFDSHECPLAVLQAMAAGVPVVARDSAALREVIDDGESGLLIAHDDRAGRGRATLSLLEQPEVRTRVVAGALQRVNERFAVARWIDDYRQIYETLADG
jgi:glycosyltransferase involved in cell wall biosynthesis